MAQILWLFGEPALEIRSISIDQIVADTAQPRKHHDEESLQGLADSIRQHGLLNPITVTPIPGSSYYRIVTGERRWRAAKLARLETLPCVVREIAEEERLTEQIIENLQREDLQPLEKARAIQQIKETLNLTTREVARRLGLSERTVGYILDLLTLPEEIGEAVVSSPNRPAAGQLTEKHARYLKQLNPYPELQHQVAEHIQQERLNSEETEKLVRAIRTAPTRAREILESAPEQREQIYQELLQAPTVPARHAVVETYAPQSHAAQKVLDMLPLLADIEVSRLPEDELIALQEALRSLQMAVESLLHACEQRSANF
ncbi:MAG TPA: ParB/RepB/Spo0J family partition protein [Chthonomonas sp.]|uniref:ParB/RepB/Spo0J family partition protein n=1 Tax=Chthonomonas sp. TaxID=2282153 RepID=UPI002B4B6C79|nr:ParB/RepB/Spo0J family partition protein [Chthonomonas sp.]HLI48385.1 ParB/RepB/Spo0J family partition protein [Chthonomonas sp.]